MPLLRHHHSVTTQVGPFPPRRLSPPRALFGRGPYLTLSRFHHPCISGSPRAESRKARRGLGFEDHPPTPLLLTGVEKGERSLPFAWMGSLGAEASPRPSKGGGHLRQALGTKKPYRRGPLRPGTRAPSGCQVRPCVTNPRSIGDNNTEATGWDQSPARPPGPRTRTGASSRIVPAPALPEGARGVAKGRSRGPRDRAARRRRRLVPPGQSSAAASSTLKLHREPQGQALLAAAEAATGPPPPPPSASFLLPSSPRRRTWGIPT